ncbi:MAG: ral nucleoside transport system ATP-binding protein [Aliidongia sp.]|jgi:simple sugar transport system ATP-binding protein|nr:ral nucleoside transport system ATP-binding protein [Aliidongia sp.]
MSRHPEPAVRFGGISKRFGAVEANRGVSFTAAAGSIHGVVGENGAGKSTLMSILYGFYQPDAGTIALGGQPVRIGNSAQAIALGIGMVHQHFVLVEDFTVLENIILGVEGRLRLDPALAAARERLAALGAAYGLTVELDAVVGTLPVGLRQRVEILKALYRGAEILILDEPTAMLGPAETEPFFAILRRLKAEGKTIFLVTHKLKEIMDLTDRVTIMRQGRVVADLATNTTGEAELAALMVGRQPAALPAPSVARPGPPALAAAGLTWRDQAGILRLNGIDLTLRAGEITGIAGVAGNGQSELLAALAGLIPADGALLWDDRAVPRQGRARTLRRLGLAHIPEDRLHQGLIAGFEAWETAILGHQREPDYARAPFLRVGRARAETRRLIAEFEIRPADPRLRSAAFSGGNQQKLIAAREMGRRPTVLLAGQPTRGVDIGAIELIHRRLRALRDAGTAILLVSSELDEILELSDRILVMVGGRIIGSLDRHAATRQRIGLMMAGAA